MSDSGSGSEVEEEYEVEAIINDRSEGNKIFLSNHSIIWNIFLFTIFMITALMKSFIWTLVNWG